MTSLRTFGAMAKVYRVDDHLERQYPEQNFALIDNRTGATIYPNMETGYYTNEAGTEQIGPGFTVYTGWDNFIRVSSPIRAFRDPS